MESLAISLEPVFGPEPLRLAIVEDEALYRDLLRLSLSQNPRFRVVGDFGSGEEALARLPQLRPQVVIMDIDLPGGMNGVQAGLRLRQEAPDLGIVLLSNHLDPEYLGAVPRQAMGGWSYLQKKSVRNVDTLARAVEGAAVGLVVLDEELVERRGRSTGPLAALSARQREVLALIAEGYTNSAIAERLVLTEKSVENYINQIYQLLHIEGQSRSVHARVAATLLYLQASRAGAG